MLFHKEKKLNSTSRGCLALVVFATALPSALRADVFQTSFEAPAYGTGQLAGQNGWSGSTFGVVENSIANTGSQAVKFDSSTVPPNTQDLTGLFETFVANAGGHEVDIQIAARFSSGSPSTNWDVLAVYSSAGFMDQLVVTGDQATLGLASTSVGSVAIATDVWNIYDLDLNYATQTASAYVNGTFIGSGAFAAASTDLTGVQFGINSAPQQDVGYFDDLSITETPEPASATLLLTLATFCATLLKKRASRNE